MSVPGSDQDAGANHRSEASLRALGSPRSTGGGATLRGRLCVVNPSSTVRPLPPRLLGALPSALGFFFLPAASSKSGPERVCILPQGRCLYSGATGRASEEAHCAHASSLGAARALYQVRARRGAARLDLEPSPPTPPPPTTSATLSVSRAVPLASGALTLGRAARKQHHIYTCRWKRPEHWIDKRMNICTLNTQVGHSQTLQGTGKV